MRELAAARDWLTVFQLPPYAPELNPVEMGLPQCELRRSPLAWLPGVPHRKPRTRRMVRVP
jgi:hypothetical protein